MTSRNCLSQVLQPRPGSDRRGGPDRTESGTVSGPVFDKRDRGRVKTQKNVDLSKLAGHGLGCLSRLPGPSTDLHKLRGVRLKQVHFGKRLVLFSQDPSMSGLVSLEGARRLSGCVGVCYVLFR